MGFLAPWFLGGLAVVGLPVWLHLLRRHKTTPQPFSSLMFFERRTQSSIKHRRLQYLLLFALRCALVVLLALAFANPFVTRDSAAATGGRKLTVLAFDNSFSMRQGNRLERARAEAASVISRLGTADRAEVLTFAAHVHVLTQPNNDASALRGAIAAVAPTDERGSFAELARALRSIAQSARMPVEAHLYSDMQKSGWPASFSDLRLPDGVTVVPHPMAADRLANFAVESVIAPRRVYTSGKVRVQATVAGYGTERATRRLSLVLNGRVVESKDLDVPAGGRATAEFLSLEAPYGLNRCEVRLDTPDAFPDDNRFYFSIERADPRRVLFVHDPRDTRALTYFRAALAAAPQAAFEVDPVSIDQVANLNPAKYSFVVLSDVAGMPGDFESNLRAYVRSGGSLLVALGRAAASRRSVPVFDEGILETRYFSRDGDRFQSAAWMDLAYPSVTGGEDWDDVKFYQAVRVQPGKARVAVRLADDTPLLLDKPVGEGRVVVFASTFDNVSNDFPLHAAFVPFIDQTARYLARLESGPANYTVGAFLDLREGQEKGAAAEVLDPSGRRALSLEEATRARNLELASTGFYDVKRPGGGHQLVAVNADRHESDFNLIPPDTLALWRNSAHTETQGADPETGTERKPYGFWWYVMLAVLVASLAESLVGNRYLAVDKEGA